MGPDTSADLRARHLEMILSVVTRMSEQSASLKGYCLTISTAIGGAAITFGRPMLGLLAVAAATMFAALDVQYLCIERRFRALFDHVRTQDLAASATFELRVKSGLGGDYWIAFRSWSVAPFYLSLGAVMVLIALVSGVRE